MKKHPSAESSLGSHYEFPPLGSYPAVTFDRIGLCNAFRIIHLAQKDQEYEDLANRHGYHPNTGKIKGSIKEMAVAMRTLARDPDALSFPNLTMTEYGDAITYQVPASDHPEAYFLRTYEPRELSVGM